MREYPFMKFRLLRKLKHELENLPISDNEFGYILSAYNISFETHRHAPNRASGEPYIMHIFRQVMRVIKLMKRHKVVSVNLICAILLHDAVEDAIKGKKIPFMVKSEILLFVNSDVAEWVISLTKDKTRETRDTFLLRVSASEVWQVLVAKPLDCNDNIITLAATDKNTQAKKVAEVFIFYPKMKEQAIKLITQEGKDGKLPNWKSWIALVRNIHRNLRRNARKQERRLEANL